MAHNRDVAGIYCSEVLAGLSDYLDGDLCDRDVERVQAHLRGCDWCERFGSQMSAVVGQLKKELASAPRVQPDMAARLLSRIESE